MESSKHIGRKTNRSIAVSSVMAACALAAIGFTASAQARDNVYWSVGVGSPGVSVGVTNARPVFAQPVYAQPVYVQQQPVYVQPRPVYVQPEPVYVQPRPYYVQQEPVYVVPERHHWHRSHHQYQNGYYVQSAAPGPWVHGPQGFQPPGYYYGR